MSAFPGENFFSKGFRRQLRHYCNRCGYHLLNEEIILDDDLLLERDLNDSLYSVEPCTPIRSNK